jgi:hypothetical protein
VFAAEQEGSASGRNAYSQMRRTYSFSLGSKMKLARQASPQHIEIPNLEF